MNNKTLDMTYIALGAVMLTICSWISIPFAVPFTLQTFAIFFILLVLGGRRGTIAIAIYILLAAIGIPVLSGFKGGIGALLGSTGGYVLGFILTGLIYWAAEHYCPDKMPVKIASLIVGLIVCYAFGTAWFIKVYASNSGPVGIGTALGWCVFPFIVPDIAKMTLAALLAERVKKAVKLN